MKKYRRKSLEVEAVAYEIGKGMEDGFMPWTSVVTNVWTATDNLVKFTREDGVVVCPFIQNRRGLVFLREGDYIITESDTERHVCGRDKFFQRFCPIEEEEGERPLKQGFRHSLLWPEALICVHPMAAYHNLIKSIRIWG